MEGLIFGILQYLHTYNAMSSFMCLCHTVQLISVT